MPDGGVLASRGQIRTEPSVAQRLAPRPVLKWAGGKRALLPELLAAFDEAQGRVAGEPLTYHEAFAGGGALFFALAARDGALERAYVNDANPHVMNVYRVVRDHVGELIERLQLLEGKYFEDLREGWRADAFACARDAYNAMWDGKMHWNPVLVAGLTIFLNHTGYNGLFRLNREGHFNVPHGSYSRPRICDEERVRTASRALQIAELTELDYKKATDRAGGPADLVYLDPPYVPISHTARFTNYMGQAFDTHEQRRLAGEFYLLARRGAWVVASNSWTPKTVSLYRKAGAHIYQVSAPRAINSSGTRRGTVPELLATSYPVLALADRLIYSPHWAAILR